MRGLVVRRIEMRTRGELHQVLVASVVHRKERQRPCGLYPRQSGRCVCGALVGNAIPEVDLQRAARDGLNASACNLVRELQRAEQISGIGQPQCRKFVGYGKLCQFGNRDGAFQQGIGGMHLQMNEARGGFGRVGIHAGSVSRFLHARRQQASSAPSCGQRACTFGVARAGEMSIWQTLGAA
jgi:hypothetical protein